MEWTWIVVMGGHVSILPKPKKYKIPFINGAHLSSKKQFLIEFDT